MTESATPSDPPSEAKPRRRRLWVAVVLVLAFASVIVARLFVPKPVDRALRSATATRAATAPILDGQLTDEVWRQATPTSRFVRFDTGRKAPLHCEARLLWDDEALYVGFSAEDEGFIATFTLRDDPLYTEDVFEIFLDPDGDGKFYTEIEISPRATLFDALFPSHRKDLARSQRWNMEGLAGAAAVTGGVDDNDERPDESWSAELRIPFAAISHAPNLPPRPGDKWRINLYRIDMHDKERGDFTAWTPTFTSDFHTLDRFGWLEFL